MDAEKELKQPHMQDVEEGIVSAGVTFTFDLTVIFQHGGIRRHQQQMMLCMRYRWGIYMESSSMLSGLVPV